MKGVTVDQMTKVIEKRKYLFWGTLYFLWISYEGTSQAIQTAKITLVEFLDDLRNTNSIYMA